MTLLASKLGFYNLRNVTAKRKVASLSESSVANKGDVFITAHRGFSGIAPENSLPAFMLAGDYGFYASECDVHLTKDGEWVINHNDTLKRMYGINRRIEEMTLNELKKLSFVKGNNLKDFPNLKIPTLGEYLDICFEKNIAPEIEIKNGNNDKLKIITDMLSERGLDKKAIIISFSREKLLKIKSFSPETELWYLVKAIKNDDIDFCKTNSIALAFSAASNSDMTIRKAINNGIKVDAWTVDSIHRLESLYKIGVRYFTSNYIKPTEKRINKVKISG